MRFLATLFALLVATPVSAQPFLYWATRTDDTIARANIDGTDVNTDFITGLAQPWDVVVDDTYIYWTSQLGPAIGRARLDGTSVEPNFIDNASGPRHLRKDDTFLYWTNNNTGSIGRARLDGSQSNPEFIDTGDGVLAGVAVSDDHIYWISINTSTFVGTMGRADLDGSNPNPAFVPAADIAVFSGSMVIAGGFVYWATNSGVGRVGLDGSNPVVDFISEATQVDGLATDGAALYISRGATFLTTIDRVDLDGSNFTELASGTGLGDAQGIAVAADASTSTAPDAVPGSAALTLALAPNPTSAATAITVEAAQTGAVQLAVYDLLGRHVTNLLDGALAGGAPQTVSFDTAGLPTGVYLVRAQSDDGVQVKRLTVVR